MTEVTYGNFHYYILTLTLYGALMSEMRGIALHHERLKCRGSNRKLIY